MTLRSGDLILPSFEDLTADRLGQHAVASASDDSRLKQAQMILSMAESLDLDYLSRRILQDGGDISLLAIGSGLRPGGDKDVD